MNTTVTTLLRDFPRVRRAAMSGTRVVIRTREGNLILVAEKFAGKALIGSLKSRGRDHGLDPSAHTLPKSAWRSRA
jgi:hypothetical protein